MPLDDGGHVGFGHPDDLLDGGHPREDFGSAVLTHQFEAVLAGDGL
jgi:hypothetical protein